MSLYVFVKPVDCTSPRMNPDVNYGLRVIMMCECRLTYCNISTTLMSEIDDGESGAAWGQEVRGKSPHSLRKFAVNLKLLTHMQTNLFLHKSLPLKKNLQ